MLAGTWHWQPSWSPISRWQELIGLCSSLFWRFLASVTYRDVDVQTREKLKEHLIAGLRAQSQTPQKQTRHKCSESKHLSAATNQTSAHSTPTCNDNGSTDDGWCVLLLLTCRVGIQERALNSLNTFIQNYLFIALQHVQLPSDAVIFIRKDAKMVFVDILEGGILDVHKREFSPQGLVFHEVTHGHILKPCPQHT